VAKDRAAPFSRKHRKYWLPVTGGMVLIGFINIAIGMCTYKTPEEPQRIDLGMPRHDAGADATGSLGASELPASVMRAFAIKYPHTIPAGAMQSGDRYILAFPVGGSHHHATFRDDGTFVTDD
jgi:hypothetical protein